MSLPLRALLVENSEDDALLLIEALRRHGYEPEFERVETAATMRAALGAQEWDIILCDYIMPRFDAPAALRIAQECNPDLPVIVVSGTVGEDIAVATIKLGAVDYLMKDRLGRLGQAVGHALDQKRLRHERTIAEQAMRESERKFASVFREAPVWIVISDVTDSRVIEVNDAALHASGYSRNEVIGHTGAELGWIRSEDRARLVQKMREQGRVDDFEMGFRARDGRQLYGVVSCGPIVIGGRQCALSVTVDITARKQAEAALQDSAAQLQSILGVAPIGIARVVERAILEANSTFVQMLGYDEGELFGKATRVLYATEEEYEAVGRQYALLAEQNKASFESRFLAKDGRLIDVAVNAIWLDPQNPAAGTVVAVMDISERKRTEQALRDSEEKFSKAFRASPDAISVHEMASGRYVDANPGVLHFFGYTREELIGRSPAELDLWALPEERAVFVERLLRDGSVRDFQARFRLRHGEVRVAELSAELMEINGRPHNVTVLRDMTARLQAEQALRDSEEKFAKAFRTSPDAISISELPTGRILEVNDVFERFAGIPRDQIIGRTSQELGLWNNPQDRDRMMEELRVRGSVRNMEVVSRTPAGALQTFLFSAEPVVIGGRDCLVVVSRNVTEQKIAEAALKDSEEKFAKAFISSPYALAISDLESGRYLDVNIGFEQVSGYTRAEAIGRSAVELGLLVDPTERDKLVGRLLQDGAVRKMEAIIRAKDGRRVVVLCNGDLLEVAGKRCLLNSFEDITERRKTEEQNLQLEAQLRQSQKLEALGTLSGGIAHDFNNILSAMIVYRELAVMDIDHPAELRNHLAEIGIASNRAKDLVRQILTFSRQERQERRAVQLHPVVREALQLLRASLPATLEIEQHIDEQAPTVLADTGQVHQIIMNLGTNAAHAMRDRPGILKIVLKRVVVDEAHARLNSGLRPGIYVRLSVRDSGHGMDADTVARIFEPFFTTKGPGEGTGLGLSVVHGIMENHDGAITVDSRPGEGTTFDLYFPRYTGSLSASQEPDESTPRGASESVLLIDDERPLCEAMRNALERFGYRVTACTDPVDALGRFRAKPGEFELLVTDHTMPHLTGLDVIQEVHRIRAGLPVLLISGRSGIWTDEKLREFKIDELVTKPLDFAALAQAVRRVLDRRSKSTP